MLTLANPHHGIRKQPQLSFGRLGDLLQSVSGRQIRHARGPLFFFFFFFFLAKLVRLNWQKSSCDMSAPGFVEP
jgi:hypothetical protein